MKDVNPLEITCPSCQTHFSIHLGKPSPVIKFCPFCNSRLYSTTESAEETPLDTANGFTSESSITFVQGHVPEKENIKFAIGPYQVLDSIGKGGMGEVFLAYDTQCGRRMALKRIRNDLTEHSQLHNRFLREARITCQLTHPAIIPIYSINSEKDLPYYTMPFVEGETLKQILRNALKQSEKNIRESSSGSIPSLTRIFLSVCQAVAYAHSKGVLHRDLKPENIIVGTYGEVLILDWGLAKLIRSDVEENEEVEEIEEHMSDDSHSSHELTRVGKVVGTVTYMAPERALGHPATFQTDVYSLGIILYQILTLHVPFRRGTLKEFRKNMSKEVLLRPEEVAPYRDVPSVLSRIVLKCLEKSTEERYQTVDELIHDLEYYIEGRSEWFQIGTLDINRKGDWEFQENILIAEHMAITRGTEVSDWVSLMISKDSYPENTKIEARVRIGEKGHGVGFLLSIPEEGERTRLNSGYCLWLGSNRHKTTKLLRSTVEVMSTPEIFLHCNEWYQVSIEKIENNIYFYLNDVLQFSYISHLPLIGTHLGLLSRDADFSIEDFTVSVGSQSIKVNCLAVPDAFLAHKDYTSALNEYRRIGYSFPGTAEGREAMFRAGITLLEAARTSNDPKQIDGLFEQALEEFGKLRGTPGAPLEYLGKALVYQELSDYKEEIKCFELALRRYQNHPLLPVLHEQLVYRMHDSSHANRIATYHFVLLAMRHLAIETESKHTKKLFSSLKKHWEPLKFIEEPSQEIVSWSDPEQNLNFSIQLAFWLASPYALAEIIDNLIKTPMYPKTLLNALFALIELGAVHIAEEKINEAIKQNPEQAKMFELITIAIQARQEFSLAWQRLQPFLDNELGKQEMRTAFYLIEYALDQQQPEAAILMTGHLLRKQLSPADQLQTNIYRIWAYFLQRNWVAAEEILYTYSLEQLTEETSLLHFLYGCWLYVTEGKEIASIHFSSILDVAHPRSWALFSHFFDGKEEQLEQWLRDAFLWEKRQLYRQNALFYHCTGEEAQSQFFQNLADQQFLRLGSGLTP